MTTKAYKPVENMVNSIRQIRDEINNEIKDMTFAEERVFLDGLLGIKPSRNETNQNIITTDSHTA